MNMRRFLQSRGAILSAVFAVLFIAPVMAFGGSKTIFVDQDNKGSEDGSANHPYQTLGKALKNAKKGTEIHVRSGTYKENITIPKEVKVLGRKKDNGDVIIKADSDKKPAVVMKDDSELDHVTVKGGQHGIRVEEDAEVIIYDVTVKDADRDGIHISSGSRDKKYQVVVSKSEVRDNKKAGIYSGKRNVVIVDTEIHSNKSDGLDFAAGTKGWVADNEIKNNGGSGAKFVLDGSEVTLKDNLISGNRREGMEIASFGANGYIGLKKAKISGNARYGIAKVARNAAGLQNFSGPAIDNSGANLNHIEKNGLGTISQVIRGF